MPSWATANYNISGFGAGNGNFPTGFISNNRQQAPLKDKENPRGSVWSSRRQQAIGFFDA